MDIFFQNFLPYLLLYKYVALFLITLLAAIALPIPSAAPLMASAAFASQGYFNIAWVFIVASLGNIIGDAIGFWIARAYGKQLLYRIGFKRIIDSPKFKTIEKRMEEKPGLIIFFSRFEVISTVSVNILSGLSRMSFYNYLKVEILGELFQVSIYVTIGYVFGSNWETVNALVNKLSIIIMAVIILLAVIFWQDRIRRKRKKSSLD